MHYEQLWAPWRLPFIQGETPKSQPSVELPPGADPACFLCRAAADEDRDRENLLVHRGEHSITVLNRYPYNNGHLLVAPRRHLSHLGLLTPEEHLEGMQRIAQLTGLLETTMRAEGFNIGLNLGRLAGAGLPGHLHWHIVSRWNGDTNFMPVLAGVHVIPQSLDALWHVLREALAHALSLRADFP